MLCTAILIRTGYKTTRLFSKEKYLVAGRKVIFFKKIFFNTG